MATFEVEAVDPVAVQAIRLIESRSNAGAVEYGSESILDRGLSDADLVRDALEEVTDMLIYLTALQARLTTPRG